MLTTLNPAVFVRADHIAVVFVQEAAKGREGIDRDQTLHKIVNVNIVFNCVVATLVKVKPDARIDWVKPTILFFKPAPEMSVMVRANDYVRAPRAVRFVEKCARFAKLLRYVFCTLDVSFEDGMWTAQFMV